MNIDDLFYLTGAFVWALAIMAVLLVFIFFVWMYVSIAVSFWWIHLLTIHKYPNCDAVDLEYRKKHFWKIRLLALILVNWQTILRLNGSEHIGTGWKADYKGFFPKVSTIEYS